MGVDKVGGDSTLKMDEVVQFLTRRKLVVGGTAAAAVSTVGFIPTSAQQLPAQAAASAPDHYHPKGKPPSSHTISIQDALRKSMPFDDKLDFEEASKGFIAAPPYRQIKAEAGHVAWDMAKYDDVYRRHGSRAACGAFASVS
jgi:hypothetical protein